jgi:hypothetical protein
MPILDGLSARVNVSIEDARITINEGQVEFDVPRVLVAIPREDCTEITRRVIPAELSLPEVEFGLGQRVSCQIWNLRAVELHYDANEIHFQVRPEYRVTLDQNLPVLGWKRVGTISGQVNVPGLVRLRLANPGASLPEVGIHYEVVPGEPDILNVPDWAETTFRPGGQTIRDKIREALTRQELIHPFRRFAGSESMQRVRVQELIMTTDATSVRLDFAVLGQVEHTSSVSRSNLVPADSSNNGEHEQGQPGCQSGSEDAA